MEKLQMMLLGHDQGSTIFKSHLLYLEAARTPPPMNIQRRFDNLDSGYFFHSLSNRIKVALWGDLANNEGQILSDKVSENPAEEVKRLPGGKIKKNVRILENLLLHP
ncbi:Uncharacterized protein Fot_22029 [Forsythia ovata]|uniref:Uncharacterized protein n=1 Tax=Forsythia ovata TaxID=205694 RepID=A0ABD1UYD7_9LAMI